MDKITQLQLELIEDVVETRLFLPSQLELASFLEKEEISINGEELRRRAKKMGADFGQRQAKYLLEHKKEMPAEWRPYHLIFTGAIWLAHAHGDIRLILCLHWNDKDWIDDLYRLGDYFGEGGRLLKPRK